MSRLSPGTVIVAIFAVLFGLVGAYAVRKSMQTPEKETPEPRMNIVPVASIDLEPGRRLTLGDVALLRLTDDQVKERGFPEGYMTNPQQIIGRILRDPNKQGEVFLTQQFYPEGMGPSIAERLKPGFRAVTVPIAANAAVSGMATAGSFVDVIFRTEARAEENLPATTVTLLESVEVLAIGRDTVPGSAPPASVQQVTLAVTPEQAAALTVVENRGQLSLSLRSPQDQEYISNPVPQTLHRLLGIEEPSPTMSTEIYRRGAVSSRSFTSSPAPVSQVTAMPLRAPRTVPASQAVSTPAPTPADEAATTAGEAAPVATEVDPLAPAPADQSGNAVESVTDPSAAPAAATTVPAPAPAAAPAPVTPVETPAVSTSVNTPVQPAVDDAARSGSPAAVEEKVNPTTAVPVNSAIPSTPAAQPTAVLAPVAPAVVPSTAIPASNSTSFETSRLRSANPQVAPPSMLNRQRPLLPSTKFDPRQMNSPVENAERPAADRRVSRAVTVPLSAASASPAPTADRQ